MLDRSQLKLPDAEAIKRAYAGLDTFDGHSANVTLLALRLFDELLQLHGLGQTERRLLLAAALLHDIGYAIGGIQRHHKNARKLILSREMPGFSGVEREMVACIARYHRKALPSKSHKAFNTLSEEQQRVVEKLAAILRVADGLDRGQWGNVQDVWVAEVTPERVILGIESAADPHLEIWAALKKSRLFARVFQREVEINRRQLIA